MRTHRSSQPLVSIVIVNYNGRRYLKNCLDSLSNVLYKNREIIVVDNASTDGSVEMTRRFYPKVTLIVNTKNEGFAGANNRAMQSVNGAYVLFLNNDTIVTPGFLDAMVAVLEKNNLVGGVQSKILLLDDKKRLDAVGAFLTNTGFLYHYGYYQKDRDRYDKRISLYTAKGACMMFRKSIVDRVGLFDPLYFAYFEETDFCHRVWLSGYKILYEPNAVIYHKMGATSNQMDNAFIQFHSFKNRIHSYIKNLGPVLLIQILPVHILFCLMVSVAFVFKGKFSHSMAIIKALIWNVVKLPQTLMKRRYIQQTIRTVSDDSFIPQVMRNPMIDYYYCLFAKGLIGYSDKE